MDKTKYELVSYLQAKRKKGMKFGEAREMELGMGEVRGRSWK